MKNNLKKFHFHPNFYFESAKDFCLHLRITSKDIANLTGCHTKTAEKWINTNNPPQWLLPFLYAVYGGVISCKSFYGWNLNNGLVNTPGSRYGLTNSQIESYHWHLDLIFSYQGKLESMRKNIDIRKNGFNPKIIKFPGA